jgi:hypothetical protein
MQPLELLSALREGSAGVQSASYRVHIAPNGEAVLLTTISNGAGCCVWWDSVMSVIRLYLLYIHARRHSSAFDLGA